MPKGPRGEKRPGDVIGAAIMVAKIATGEIEDPRTDAADKKAAKVSAGRKGGSKRAETLSPARRTEIAKTAARARWPESADE